MRRASPDAGVFFAQDSRENVTFEATNLAGQRASCTVEVTTFTPSKNWKPSDMAIRGEDQEDVGGSSPGTDPTAVTYYVGATYAVDGPITIASQAGFNPADLFVGFAGDAARISFKIDVFPASRRLVFVDPETGDLIVTPNANHTGQKFTATLRGIDIEGAEAVVKKWAFDVVQKPEFRIINYTRSRQRSDTAFVNVIDRAKEPFACKIPFGFAPINLTATAGQKGTATFTVGGVAPEGLFLNPQTGEVQGFIDSEADYNITLEAIDESGTRALIEELTLRFQNRDTDVERYGPKGKPCANGVQVDTVPFDRAYTCECDAAEFTGENCEVGVIDAARSSADGGQAAWIVVACIFGLTLLGCGLWQALAKFLKYRESMKACDFAALAAELARRDGGTANGDSVYATPVFNNRVPREYRRQQVRLAEVLGSGEFGQVWKCVLNRGSDGGEILAAAKVATASDGSNDDACANQGLLDEALLMCQVTEHPNVVGLVGVVTVGFPKIIMLNFCEWGALLGLLRQAEAHEGPLCTGARGPATKTNADIGLDVARGMHHLEQAHIVHRDLAARNVLVDTVFQCKVADFGLSRIVEDTMRLYYRSQGGMVPIRWTAPEALESQRYSTASDVWSFGIVMCEVYTGGDMPYPDLRNDMLPEFLESGKRHTYPERMPQQMRGLLAQCWEQDPSNRCDFANIVDVLTHLAATDVGRTSTWAGAGACLQAAATNGPDPHTYDASSLTSTIALQPPRGDGLNNTNYDEPNHMGTRQVGLGHADVAEHGGAVRQLRGPPAPQDRLSTATDISEAEYSEVSCTSPIRSGPLDGLDVALARHMSVEHTTNDLAGPRVCSKIYTIDEAEGPGPVQHQYVQQNAEEPAYVVQTAQSQRQSASALYVQQPSPKPHYHSGPRAVAEHDDGTPARVSVESDDVAFPVSAVCQHIELAQVSDVVGVRSSPGIQQARPSRTTSQRKSKQAGRSSTLTLIRNMPFLRSPAPPPPPPAADGGAEMALSSTHSEGPFPPPAVHSQPPDGQHESQSPHPPAHAQRPTSGWDAHERAGSAETSFGRTNTVWDRTPSGESRAGSGGQGNAHKAEPGGRGSDC